MEYQNQDEYIKVLEEQIKNLEKKNRELMFDVEYWSNKCEHLEVRKGIIK